MEYVLDVVTTNSFYINHITKELCAVHFTSYSHWCFFALTGHWKPFPLSDMNRLFSFIVVMHVTDFQPYPIITISMEKMFLTLVFIYEI